MDASPIQVVAVQVWCRACGWRARVHPDRLPVCCPAHRDLTVTAAHIVEDGRHALWICRRPSRVT